MKVCERAELRFTDSEFIPSPSTLGYGIDDCLRGWMRMADIADQPRLFDEVIDLHDIEIHMKAFSCIVQALSALAVKTDLTSFLRRIFSTKQVSYWSVYNLNLYHIELQKWVQIVTDDYVPVDYSHQPYFVRYRDPEVIWLPLLVKALAKLHGSYKNLSEQTDVGRLLEILTGEKPLVLTDFDIDRIAVICPDPSFSILAIPHLSNTNIDLLLPWHQAYILSEIRQSNDGQIRLAVVRRIWGRFESFRGKWANESDLWTSVLKSDLGFDEIGTDSFFADPVELALMFKYVYIVRVPKPSNIFKFLTSQEGVWHKSLSNGIGSVHNPQWMFATKRVSVVIALSTGFRDRTHQATISLILCRIRGKLPLTDLNEQDIISKNDAEGSKCSQIEVTLPGSRSGKPALYGIIAWFGGLPGENLQAAFTLTVKSTERIFLSRSQFVTQELAADVLRNRPDILRIPTLIR